MLSLIKHSIKFRLINYYVILLVGVITYGCESNLANEVVVYTSLDQIFSEPILKEFERQTKIKVKCLYDTEAAKTVGLVNRLLAEKENPQADVFWNSEIVRTLVLKKKGVLVPYLSPQAETLPVPFKDPQGYWTGFAARARVLVVNRTLVPDNRCPRSLKDLADPAWRGRAGLALPLFGTTNTQALALYQVWGISRTEEFFRDCLANQTQILDGNSVVRDRVADGVLAFGLTDSDDAYVGEKRGKPVALVYPDQGSEGTLLIPNTVALIAGGPHPEQGKKLIDFLLSEQVEEALAQSDSMQIPLRPQVHRPLHVPALQDIKVMQVDFEALADKAEEYSLRLRELFLK